ncbi:acyl-CoA dehydrogenase [Myxococcus stipitatus DSM 14675]|uniref:Acyl-CoA dehydrogenase n=1 Tax=Myxococcus stipitatus (strain DSM 14675 / JCM 12634 / Mx s8) TaxID=1278073 RepID=L7UB36_MYXSD|nr:acyl-CoA dehydrogenase [Myxococcus stipitatus]AGC46121.1 acyl-CoA dehydrogenase [Myxococcus stipitatus DSM 14675]
MGLLETTEQESLRETARRFVHERMPLSHVRQLRDSGAPDGLSRETWRELAGLGLAGIMIPVSHGGMGLGWTELGLVLEECGRTLAPTPMMSTVVLGSTALTLGGTASQLGDWLRPIASGEKLLALAHDEGTRHAPYGVGTRASLGSDGYRIQGEKALVLDGHLADALIVVARTSGSSGEREGLTLFLVPAQSHGLHVTRTLLVDSRNAARVRLDEVLARPEDILGTLDRGAEVLDPLLDRARVALSAEMLGGLVEAFESTLTQLKSRKQFGVAIGSFQALKHRVARLHCEVSLTRAIITEALHAIDEDRSNVPLLASAAKARASDTFLHVANEAIQLHGGMGVTDACDIGLFLKRARVAAMTFGDGHFHRDHFARLRGY